MDVEEHDAGPPPEEAPAAPETPEETPEEEAITQPAAATAPRSLVRSFVRELNKLSPIFFFQLMMILRGFFLLLVSLYLLSIHSLHTHKPPQRRDERRSRRFKTDGRRDREMQDRSTTHIYRTRRRRRRQTFGISSSLFLSFFLSLFASLFPFFLFLFLFCLFGAFSLNARP